MKTWAKIEGGYIVAVASAARQPVGQWEELPAGAWPGWQARPSPAHKPRRIGNLVAWEDPRSLEQARAARIALIREARDAHINGTFWWDGSEFDSDQVSQTRLLGAVVAAAAQGFEPVAWRLADNTWRILTASDLAAVYGALQAHLRDAFSDFSACEAAINAATTVAAVDAVTWE